MGTVCVPAFVESGYRRQGNTGRIRYSLYKNERMRSYFKNTPTHMQRYNKLCNVASYVAS